MPSHSASPRLATEALIVGVVVGAILLLARTPTELLAPGAFKDDAVYLTLGRAIASGNGYHSIYMPGAPLQVKYPPGLPLIYSLLWRLLGALPRVFTAARDLSAIATAAAAATVWYIARARLAIAVAIALPFAIGPFLFESAIQYYTLPISESWYVFSWALVVLFALRVCDRSSERAMRDAICLGVVLAGAMLVRTQAVALFGGAVVTLLLARRFRETAIAALIGVTPVAVWQMALIVMRARGASVSTLADETAYTQFAAGGTPLEAIGSLASGVPINVREYYAIFSPYLSGYTPIGGALAIAIVALAAIGAWRIGKDALILPLTVAASAALTLVWPWTQDRLLIPLFPFLGLIAASALQSAGVRLSRSSRLIAAVVLAAVVLGAARQQLWLRTQAYQASADGKTPAVVSPTWVLPQNSRLILIEALWIDKHARPDDRLLAATPAGLFLQTGRTGLSSSPAESRLALSAFAVPGRFLARAINDNNISLVLIEAPDDLRRDVGVVERACPNAFHEDGRAIGGWPYFLRVVDTSCIARAFP
jgi:hypothetical protein